MAVRIRKNGKIICAAASKPMKGDIYLDDGVHYLLSVEMGVLQEIEGTNYWEFGKRKKGYKSEKEYSKIILSQASYDRDIEACNNWRKLSKQEQNKVQEMPWEERLYKYPEIYSV